jgi:DNA replication licensing factor MCM5
LHQAQRRHGQSKSMITEEFSSVVASLKMNGKEKSNVGTRQPYLRVLGIRIDTDGVGRSSAQTLTTAEEEEFIRFSHTPNVYDTISSSVAPSIYGATDIKKAVACLLFGGSRKRSVRCR